MFQIRSRDCSSHLQVAHLYVVPAQNRLVSKGHGARPQCLKAQAETVFRGVFPPTTGRRGVALLSHHATDDIIRACSDLHSLPKLALLPAVVTVSVMAPVENATMVPDPARARWHVAT